MVRDDPRRVHEGFQGPLRPKAALVALRGDVADVVVVPLLDELALAWDGGTLLCLVARPGVEHLEQVDVRAHLKDFLRDYGADERRNLLKVRGELEKVLFLVGALDANLVYLFDEELPEGVIVVTGVDELADHLKEGLHRLAENRAEEADSLQVGFAAHEDLVEVGQERGASWELLEPRLVAYDLQVLLELHLEIDCGELGLPFAGIEQLLELFEALLQLFLDLLLLVDFFHLRDVVDELLGKANSR